MIHLTMFQKGPSYAGIKTYNYLPSDIKDVACNLKQFKKALKKFLHVQSFYTIN